MTDYAASAPGFEMARFTPPKRVLLGPGPSPVDQRVIDAMSVPLLGHLDPAFLKCMDEIQTMLRYVFQTKNRVTFPISGTGSAGMEAAIVNAVETGDDVVVCAMGAFGERMLEIAERAGANVVAVRSEWGEPVDRNRIEAALKACRPRALALVHAETSTGVLQDLEGLAELAHSYGSLLIVDAVASLGGLPVAVDRDNIDICYSGSQKCLSAPPGLAPITLSDLALERIRTRRSKVQSWYLDISMVEHYWNAARTYHHTAPISNNYALHEALRLVCEEGLEARWRRHRLNYEALVAGIEAMDIAFLVPAEQRPWSVNAVCVPDGIDDVRVRRRLVETAGVDIAGGLGKLKSKVWRIGLMGSGSTQENVLLLLNGLHAALTAEGYHCSSGVAAAEAVYSGDAVPA